MPSHFKLEKFYMDVVTPDNHAFIGYAASVSWKKIRLDFTGHLYSDGVDCTDHNSFAGNTHLHDDGNSFSWNTGNIRAMWERLDSPIEEVLLNGAAGSIHWSCFAPKSNGTVQLDGVLLKGFGYAEKIVIALPPWQIPIRELYWGRLLGENFTVVWIEWKGSVPKQLLFINGRKIESVSIGDDHIAFEDYEIKMTTAFLLRSGSLGSTVFAGFKKIMALFPSSVFRMQETKWSGRADLYRAGEKIESGMFIHEKVCW